MSCKDEERLRGAVRGNIRNVERLGPIVRRYMRGVQRRYGRVLTREDSKNTAQNAANAAK